MTFSKTLLSLAVCLSLTACGEKSFDEHMQAAKQANEKSDTRAASIELKNAIRKAPDNAKARFLLGQLYFNAGQLASAEKELSKAFELDSNKSDYLDLLIRAYYLNNSYPQIIELSQTNNNKLISYYSALINLSEGKADEAKIIFETLSKSDKNESIKNLATAYLEINQQQFDQAVASVEKVLSKDKNNLEALLLKGKLGTSPAKAQLAIDAYSTLIELMPQHHMFALFLASAYVNAEQFDKAEPYINNLLKVSPNNPFTNQLKAKSAFNANNYEAAKQHSEKAIQGKLDSIVTRLIAGFSNYKINKYEQAYKHLSKISDKIPTEHLAKKVLIDLQLKLGYQDEALSNINSLSNISKADASLLTGASEQLFLSGKEDEAKELLESAIKLDSKDAKEIAKQGLLQLKLEQDDAAIASLEKALKLDPSLDIAEQALAASYVENEQFELAKALAEKWAKSADTQSKVESYLLESAIYHKQKNLEQAKTYLEKALKLNDKTVIASYKLGLYAQAEKKAEPAFNYFSQTLTNSPSYKNAWQKLVQLSQEYPELYDKTYAFINDEIDRAEKKRATEKASENKAEDLAQQALAYFYIAHKKYQEAISALKVLKDGSAKPQAVDSSLGDLYQRIRDWDNSIKHYQAALNVAPDDLALSYKLLTTYEMAGKIGLAHKEVNKILRKNKDNLGFVLLKVYYQSLLNEEPNALSMKQLGDNEKTSQNWLYHRTVANLAYKKQDFKKANKHNKIAYQSKKSAINAINLARSESKLNGVKASIAVLKSHSETDNNPMLKTMLADAYLTDKQLKNAESLYEELVKINKKNVIVLNNLAYIKLQAKDTKPALEYSKKAIEIAPQSPAVMDTYAQALLLNKQTEEALKYFDQALAIIPKNIEINANKAKALIANNKAAEAKTLLKGLDLSEANKEEKKQVSELLKSL